MAAKQLIELRFRFPHSRSPRLPLLVDLAKRGILTESSVKPGRRKVAMYEATFSLTDNPAEVDRLVQLCRLLRDLRHAELLVNGRRITPWKLEPVLRCYQASLRVSDARAHCWVESTVIGAPLRVRLVADVVDGKVGEPEVERPAGPWFFPCRLGASWTQLISLDHPSTLRAQVEAMIVERECDWCPSLRLDEWELNYGRVCP